jgi:hypothetical protein
LAITVNQHERITVASEELLKVQAALNSCVDRSARGDDSQLCGVRRQADPI